MVVVKEEKEISIGVHDGLSIIENKLYVVHEGVRTFLREYKTESEARRMLFMLSEKVITDEKIWI